ncbi:MAG: DUF3943 domain-containing protein [Deltaproteobacteria bacterium]|nr:MAG: DUF3943 domain-containing protein [Deltaproteobacteria bacterium]
MSRFDRGRLAGLSALLLVTLALLPQAGRADIRAEVRGAYEAPQPRARLCALLGRVLPRGICEVREDSRLKLHLPELGFHRLLFPGDDRDRDRRRILRLVERLKTEHPEEAELLFVGALPLSERLRFQDGVYLDTWTGDRLNFDEAFARMAVETPDPRNFPRASLELTVGLGLFLAWYLTATEVNAPDWQYQTFPESLRAKFVTFEGWRFDDNAIHLNSPGHALAGVGYHQVARANGLSVAEGLGAALFGSIVWEVGPEWREVLSMGDVFLGGAGALSLGEASFQLGRFFRASADTPLHRVLATLFDPFTGLHLWMDGVGPEGWHRAPRLGRGGHPADIWHRVEARSGGSVTQRADPLEYRADLVLELEAEILRIPEFGRARSSHRLLRDPVRASLELSLSAGAAGVLDLLLHGNTVLLAWHEQEIGESTPRGRFGYALTLGLGADYHHATHRYAAFDDYFGAAGPLGPVVDLTLFEGPWSLRLVSELYPIFALTRALAFEAYLEDGGTQAGLPGSLAKERYYYAYGATLRERAVFHRDRVELGGEVWIHRFQNLGLLDRYQEAVRPGLDVADGVLRLRGWLAHDLSPTTRLTLLYELRRRWGVMEGRAVEAIDRRLLLLAGLNL